MRDHTLFSRAEHVAAFRLLVPLAEAEREADELLAGGDLDAGAGLDCYMGDDNLNLLSLVSADCAERVRTLMEESPEEAAERIRRFRKRLDLAR